MRLFRLRNQIIPFLTTKRPHNFSGPSVINRASNSKDKITMKTNQTTHSNDLCSHRIVGLQHVTEAANLTRHGTSKLIGTAAFIFTCLLLGFAPTAWGAQCDIVVQGTPTISPNPVNAGSPITVYYTIHNNGPGDAGSSQTKIQIKTLRAR